MAEGRAGRSPRAPLGFRIAVADASTSRPSLRLHLDGIVFVALVPPASVMVKRAVRLLAVA